MKKIKPKRAKTQSVKMMQLLMGRIAQTESEGRHVGIPSYAYARRRSQRQRRRDARRAT